MKAHNDNVGNEIADQLAKKAASGRDGKNAYTRIPKSAVIKAIREKGELRWQPEWNVSTKGEITKSFFPDIGVRISKRLRMGVILATMVTEHGILRSYYPRFKIKDDPECVCRMGPQTTNHLLSECEHLLTQRKALKNRVRKAGGNWIISNSDLANSYTKWFQIFVNSIDLDAM